MQIKDHKYHESTQDKARSDVVVKVFPPHENVRCLSYDKTETPYISNVV